MQYRQSRHDQAALVHLQHEGESMFDSIACLLKTPLCRGNRDDWHDGACAAIVGTEMHIVLPLAGWWV